MKLVVHFSTCFLLIVNLQVIAQPDIKFHSITTKDGLAGDIVYTLHQDKQGFLWIGTHRGLNRYDGYSFRLYVYDPSDTNSLSGNHIHCIKEDAEGVLWLGTDKGLNSLDPVSGKIKRHALPNSAMSAFMEHIFFVNDSIILISAYLTLYRFNKRTEVFTKIAVPESEAGFSTDNADFAQDTTKENVFIGSVHYDCVLINWKNATASYLPSREVLNALPKKDSVNQPIRRVYIDAQNNAWCFNGAVLLSKSIGGKKVNYPYNNYPAATFGDYISSFFEEPNDKLWICTTDGLVLYDYVNNSFYRYQQQKGKENSLPFNNIRSMLRDRNGVYWVGTFGGGISYFKLSSGFKNIIVDSGSNKRNYFVWGLKALHSGKILVGTPSSKMFIIEKNKTARLFDQQKVFREPVNTDSFILEYTGMNSQFFSQKDRSLLYDYFSSLIPEKRSSQGIMPFKPVQYYFAHKDLIITNNRKVWIFYGDNLYDGNFHPLTGLNQVVISFTPTDDDNFLFATTQGLVHYDTRKNAVTKTYLPEPGNPYSIASSSIYYIIPAGKNNYWIAMGDAGLDYWDTKADRFYHYTTADGLPDNTIYTMLPDRHGRLWLSTNKGLSCFDTAAKTFTNYDTYDGLINTEYNRNSACADNEGFMYFGGMDGIDYFHPDSFLHKSSPPVLYIAGFKIHDKLQPVNSAYALATNDNNIDIEFTGNDFLNAKKIMFRYQLSDVDKEWVIEQGINKAGYNKLPPGKYRFSVQASYNGKIWSKPLAVDFAIATPWFQSWRFYTLLVLATITGIYAFFNYRLQRQLEKQQAVENIRAKISMDIHDEIGSQLTKISLLSQRIKIGYNKQKEVDEALINKITASSKEVVRNLGEIIWAVNPKHDNLQSLLAYLRNYIPNFFEQTNVDYAIDFPDDVPAITISPELKHNLFLVIKESLNNIIKHAAATEVKINFQFNGQTFCFEIVDNGKGIADLNGRDFGNGLINMKNRMKTVNGKFEIASEINKGTNIRLKGTFNI